MQARAFFMPTPDGQRLCIFHPPQGTVLRGRVLYIHPLAEEMNKARRMAALQARALAAAGFAVLQIDLLGCGDSSGDFGDARWDAWVTDVVRACAWLGQQAPAPLWLWGLRAGCLLAQEAALQLDTQCHFLLWQPPATGRLLLQQFLRLHTASAMRTGSASHATQALRAQLQQGAAVEVAGYMLSANVAQGLEQAVLEAPSPAVRTQRIEWFEVSPATPARLGTLSDAARLPWSHPALRLVRHALRGPAFWQSSAVEEVPDLLEATTRALCAPGV